MPNCPSNCCCPSARLIVCSPVCLLVLQSVNVPSSSFYRFCDCFRSSEKTRIANFKHASMICRHWNSICIVHTPRCPQAHIPRFTRAAARGQGWAGHSRDAQERRGVSGQPFGFRLSACLRFRQPAACGQQRQRLANLQTNICSTYNLCKYIANIYVQPQSIHTHLIACCAIKLNQFCICLIIVIIISILISTSITRFFVCLDLFVCRSKVNWVYSR